ncbi:hypothetical protein [Kitasatospora sp. NPDC001175]|uniref:hypothetical protein n=1 Tax=Kitasatospora sp. NPDC001175 TaxID=3157103 RepID=UPI003CFC591C
MTEGDRPARSTAAPTTGAGGRPDLDEIEARFTALVEGRLSRDEADRWAGRWLADDGLVWDELSYWALDLLHGIDLPAGPDGGHLHGDGQLRCWLAEFRVRRGGSDSPSGVLVRLAPLEDGDQSA